MTVAKINSYAKVNLFLDILGKREDGYHNIRSVFSEIGLFDEIKYSLTKNSEIDVLTNKPFIKKEDNLIYKVALFIQNAYSVKNGVKIELTKNIPLAAGLGGGSSNAAATITALSELWGLKLNATEKHSIAARFGSDINFFLEGETALGTQRGEEITKREYLCIEHLLLVNPGFGISSQEAYRLVQIGEPNYGYLPLLETSNLHYCYNKLEEQIRKKYSVIDTIIKECLDKGAISSILSGSGATVLAFFTGDNELKKVQEHFEGYGYWTCATKTIRRSR